MAKEARKRERATRRRQVAAAGKTSGGPASKSGGQVPPAPEILGATQLRALGWRVGLPLAAVWLVAGLISGVSQSAAGRWVPLLVASVLTGLAAGLVLWALRYARKARGVHSILSQVESAEDRKQALEKLDSSYKKKDHAAIFAKAQLLMQEDPRQALEVLERIDLGKAMAPVADEARAQRAMIHLMLGEVKAARPLADGIDLKRHQDPKTRAMLAAVTAEAWARSGQANRGLETLSLFDPQDEEFAQVRPQIWRAQCYAYAHTNNLKAMRRVLRKLLAEDVRLLGGFMMKRTHPMLQKEARKLAEQSGQVPRRMEIVRR